MESEFEVTLTEPELSFVLGAAEVFLSTSKDSKETALLRAILLLRGKNPRRILDGLQTNEEEDGTQASVTLTKTIVAADIWWLDNGRLRISAGPLF